MKHLFSFNLYRLYCYLSTFVVWFLIIYLIIGYFDSLLTFLLYIVASVISAECIYADLD